MVDEKGMCVDRIHLYYTLRKTPIKRKKKGFFFNKKRNPITNGVRQEYT